MSLIFGLLAGAFSAWTTFVVGSAAFGNAGSSGSAAVLALAALAALVGFLAASSAYRRARRTHDSISLFTGLAFGFSFAALGAAFMIALTAVYISQFAPPGEAGASVAVTVAAVAVLAALGACLGALVGWLLGLVAASALRFLAPATG